MPRFRRMFRASSAVLLSIGVLSACSGAPTAGTSSLPGLSGYQSHSANRLEIRGTAAAAGDIVAINAGGGTAGSFATDQDYATSSWTYKTTSTIDTSGVTNPPPQAVFADEREGATVAYTIPGLTAGAAYQVRLSFAELWWTAAGQRVFNISINGTKQITNFDIFAAAGAKNKAVTESFTATASSAGTILITLNAVINNAALSAVEVASAGATPAPTPTPATSSGLAINAGGPASGGFAADEFFVTHGSWTTTSTATVDTSAVTNPPPQAVYDDQRVGTTISYVIPGLIAGTTYAVRLDFVELFFKSAGQRVFNVSINNTSVLTNFDVVAAAGARDKAIAESFNATASSSGTVTIMLTAVTNYAAISALEITAGSGPPPTQTPTPTAEFNDYASFGYDNQHDVFNPNTTAITPVSMTKLHTVWQSALGGGDYNTQTQPTLATEINGHAGVLFAGGAKGNVYGYDALTGKLIWTTHIGQETYTICGPGTASFGIGGTVAYDAPSKSLYVIGNTNAAANAFANNALYHLDAATGQILGHVDFVPTAAGASELDFSHTAVTLNNGIAYVGTGSTCDISSWRGRVVAINVPSMTIANTFFTVWDPQNLRGKGAQPWGGGGIWGWGGVSLDFSGNVLTGVGNADNGSPQGTIEPPFAKAPQEYSGYAETLLELSPNITAVVADNHPIPTTTYGGASSDLDVQGTPLVFRPTGAGCGTMVALQGKSGELTLYDENALSNGFAAQYQLSPSKYADGYLGDPAYSPATGLVYAPVASSISPTLFAPGMIAINPGCGKPSVTWHASFGTDSSGSGIPRSVPAVSAGGVVFAGAVAGKGGGVYAIDASTGAILNGGTPLLLTSGYIRMPPTIDGDWVFVLDDSGNMYGLTTDSRYPAIQTTLHAADSRQLRRWEAVPAP